MAASCAAPGRRCRRPQHALCQQPVALPYRGGADDLQRGQLPAAVHRIPVVSAADPAASWPGKPGTDRALALSDRSASRGPAAAAVGFVDLREVGDRRRRSHGFAAGLAAARPRALWPLPPRAALGVGPPGPLVRLLLRRRSRSAGAEPRFCWPAVRRSAFPAGRRLSSPAVRARCWTGLLRNPAWRRWPYAGSLIAGRSSPWPPSNSTRGGLWT